MQRFRFSRAREEETTGPRFLSRLIGRAETNFRRVPTLRVPRALKTDFPKLGGGIHTLDTADRVLSALVHVESCTSQRPVITGRDQGTSRRLGPPTLSARSLSPRGFTIKASTHNDNNSRSKFTNLQIYVSRKNKLRQRRRGNSGFVEMSQLPLESVARESALNREWQIDAKQEQN